MDTFGITESSVVIKQAFLTLIVEDRGFHTAMFYLKCFCVPFILGGEFSKSTIKVENSKRCLFLSSFTIYEMSTYFRSVSNSCLFFIGFVTLAKSSPRENKITQEKTSINL